MLKKAEKMTKKIIWEHTTYFGIKSNNKLPHDYQFLSDFLTLYFHYHQIRTYR